MKNFTYHLCICLFVMGLNINTQAQITEQITYSTNEVEIIQTNNYDKIRLKRATMLIGEEYVGQPQLPMAHVNILLPKGATATNVSIASFQQSQLQGNFYLYPVQTPYAPNFSDPPPFVEPNTTIYNSNVPFPDDPLLSYSTHIYREYSYVDINFIPFSYLPQSGQLYLLTDLNINVSYSINPNIEDTVLRPTDHGDELAYRSVKNKVRNKTDIDAFYSETMNSLNAFKTTTTNIEGHAFETTELPSVEGGAVEYVIITNDTDLSGTTVGDFVQKFQQFADWKTQKGTPAKVITVDVIRENYPGVDVAEKIRHFVQDAYQKWGTEYVLLGGGASDIP